MTSQGSNQPHPSRSPERIWSDWMEANAAGDVDRAAQCAESMTEAAPDVFDAWFEAGLHAKARRDWTRCRAWNARAMELFGDAQRQEFEGANPAAWNLGIAATALGDWATARRAWTAYGITGIGEGAGEIDENFGMTPIRLNPDRASLALQVQPEHGRTEVVWCWRRSPAHAVIASVPLPDSGHRFRDVLLHDGEPKGTRRSGETEVSVFDEIARLHESQMPTWQAQVSGASEADIDAAIDLFAQRGLGADNWAGINLLCADCSHGSPGAEHQHQQATAGTVSLGLAGPEDDVAECLASWRAARPGVDVPAVDLLW